MRQYCWEDECSKNKHQIPQNIIRNCRMLGCLRIHSLITCSKMPGLRAFHTYNDNYEISSNCNFVKIIKILVNGAIHILTITTTD